MRRFFLTLVFAAIFLFDPRLSAAPVMVRFDPSNSVASVGGELTVNLLADIPDPVLGWGLRVVFDPAVLSIDGTTIGPEWFAVTFNDPDVFGGLAFPTPISGSGTLLATFMFHTLTSGASVLHASADPLDTTQGFPLVTGGFASIVSTDGSVQVTQIPELPTSLLIVSGLTLIGGYCRMRCVR
jgi:hypothetical protein